MDHELKIITVATHSQAYFPVLEKSCHRNNIELTVLGWGEKWGGFGWKLNLLKDYFNTLPEDETVLVLDAFDAFILADSKEILHKFKMMNKPMVCGAERKHSSRVWNVAYENIFNKTGEYPPTPTAYKYLNAGGWIASAGYALQLLENTPIKNSTNDQTFLTYLYLKGKVLIDYNCDIFTCIRRESDLIPSDNRLINTFTGTYPCVVHAPADVSMNKLVSHMHYEPIKYDLIQRVWKYIYSVYAFWGSTSFKKKS